VGGISDRIYGYVKHAGFNYFYQLQDLKMIHIGLFYITFYKRLGYDRYQSFTLSVRDRTISYSMYRSYDPESKCIHPVYAAVPGLSDIISSIDDQSTITPNRSIYNLMGIVRDILKICDN
jgi:hypothetical protein